MDPERFELSTFSMPLRRAPNCAMGPYIACNDPTCLPPVGVDVRMIQTIRFPTLLPFRLDIRRVVIRDLCIRHRIIPLLINCRKNKKPSPNQGRRSLRGTTLLVQVCDRTALARANGRNPSPATLFHRLNLPSGGIGEFGLERSADAMPGSHYLLPTRWRMTYYSYEFSIYQEQRLRSIPSGPRGIRTPDLLNAIETRSQLRYGPRSST